MAANKEHKPVSLGEVHDSVSTERKGFWRKLFAFIGPAYLVSVGYMDPGNWATDIAGGSQFGYSLLWVLLLSNLMALLLQGLSARLGLVRGRDLAQASKELYPAPVNMMLYLLAEVAIAACDLAEVLGMAIGLQLLFGLPLIYGVCITVLDTFLLLFLLNFGIRRMEAFIITLVATIGASFFLEMIFAKPDAHAILSGFVPSIPGDNALYIAIGIIGATVMPHNLYLHSALVQTRKFEHSSSGIKKAIRFNLIDSTIALNLAFFVNSAILILAATAFFNNGLYEVAGIQDAHRFLQPLLGTRWAPILFAVALIAAGQSSTVTGTLAGQIVMEGYLNLRIQPWVRRIITRLLAIVPALLVIYFMGEAATGRMLIFSQVILSVQLGFAVIPLVHLVSDKKKMGEFAIKKAIKILAWSCAILIVLLNMVLIIDQLTHWLEANGSSHVFASTILIAAAILAILLLCYIFLAPFIKVKKHLEKQSLHMEPATLSPSKQVRFKKIAVAVDFSSTDIDSIRHALSLGAKNCEYCLVHVVETVGARIMGSEIKDMETQSDLVHLQNYVDQIARQGYSVTYQLGYGSPKKAIPNIVNAYRADLLILGAHGHTTWKDMLLGTTIEAVRHRVQAPVMIVQRAS